MKVLVCNDDVHVMVEVLSHVSSSPQSLKSEYSLPLA